MYSFLQNFSLVKELATTDWLLNKNHGKFWGSSQDKPDIAESLTAGKVLSKTDPIKQSNSKISLPVKKSFTEE